MSTVFESSFNGSRAVPRASDTVHGVSRAIDRLAAWLGLARPAPQCKTAAPQRRDSVRRHAALFAAGEQMLAQARLDNHALSVVVFELSDLPELESVFGAPVVREVLVEVATRLQDLATTRGLVIRTGPTFFTVLIPGFGRDRTHLAIEETMGSPCCIELNAGDHEIVLIPDFKLHTVRPGSPGLAQIQQDLRRQIEEAQTREARRRRYLQKERESHTRPMDLRMGATRTTSVEHQHAAPAHQATVPVPLRA
jgi:GGDEF domain-containing protein